VTTSILGTRVARTEDPALVRGGASYAYDLRREGLLHAVFVRSELPHALLRGVDADAARSMPGVVGVYLAADLGLPAMHTLVKIDDALLRPPLATDRVRFVGDIVAVVVADTETEARDAAVAVVADLDPLEPVVDPEEALAEGAPLLFPVRGSNVAVRSSSASIDAALESCDRVVRGRFVNQRIAIAPLETHAILAEPSGDGRLLVHPSSQQPHTFRRLLAESIGVPEESIRVVTPQVGGGFGGKVGIASEHAVVAALALRLGRPVRWMATRSEDLGGGFHGRGQIQWVELGCSNDGRLRAIRASIVCEAGAYPGIGALLPFGTRSMLQGVYTFEAAQCEIASVATNTAPTGAYRGAGRPEAAALIERAVDMVADELGIDPLQLRLANLIPNGSFPYTTLTGSTYDSGDYALPLREAARIAGYDGWRDEQRRRREAGDPMFIGIGVAAYVEITAGGESSEYARVEVHGDGTATVHAGTSSHGQGHQTAYAMIVSEATGIPVDRIVLAPVDTDLVRSGGGTAGSRSMQLGGSAVKKASDLLVDKARILAASVLEADPADVVLEDGSFAVRGVPARALDWALLARAAASDEHRAATDTGDGLAGLAAHLDFDQGATTFPFGAHVSVVEVDSETGRVRVLRHVAVDDCGRVINPALVEGQQHGGMAAGISQALYEEIRYDADGNLVTSTFAEYAFPSAAEFPSFDAVSTETPTPLNPLGAKGIGEAATIGSTPAVQNAVVDALSHLGVRHLDLPCTAERVWRAIEDARIGILPDPWRDRPAVFGAGTVGASVDEATARAADGI
jgi:carbon-monoxide dehydrogenase large subunit